MWIVEAVLLQLRHSGRVTSLEVEVFVGRCVEIDRAETEAHVATLRLSGRTGVSACTRTILRGELLGALLSCWCQNPEGPRMF
jgi:hypothetical protein